jgi:MFS family permease
VQLSPPPRRSIARADPRRPPVLLVATLILTVVAFQLNSSMISPALPDIAKQLGAPMDAVSQVSSLFFLAGAVGGIVLARWSDFIGRKRALLIVLALIGLGTVLCLVSRTSPCCCWDGCCRARRARRSRSPT